ncbi:MULTISPECIES: tetratricopeptide repeat protein [Streptomyces]|uniref:Tetratricopeptide repeat protein n=1 Tax=Streptomyces mimosae TaxID=2586635 RepID=A0A5N5ZZP3_9ACTN|nr:MULTISPECIES: tetratricopeptide repeat protein [Streptomyces]KAB8161283.1 tetratricopeptide repeat protein [Streptomyces mimosae]
MSEHRPADGPERPAERSGGDENGGPPGDDVVGVRTGATFGPRWADVAALANEAVRLHARGRTRRAREAQERVLAATEVPDVDVEGLDVRARALANLAALAEERGEPRESLRLAGEALAVCDRIEERVGDARGTPAVRGSVLVNRAQTLQLLGRNEEALADCDAALALPVRSGPGSVPLNFALHNSRGCTLIALGRYPEAEAEVRAALAIAQEHEPRLAGHAHTNLAVLAGRAGDLSTETEHLRLAREFHHQGGDPIARALSEENLARLDLGERRLGRAERGLRRAERAYTALGAEHRAASVQFGLALLAFLRGRVGRARRVLRRAMRVLERTGEVGALVECHLLAGDLAACRLRFKAADRHYLAARALCFDANAPHEAARVDARRARVVLASLRLAWLPPMRRHLLGAALDVGLPAALATDALRHGFPPGRARERWTTEVARPALATALKLLTLAQQPRLAVELIEHIAASATLDAERPADEPARAGGSFATELRSRIVAAPFGQELPEPFPAPAEPVGEGAFAASLAAGGGAAADGFPAPRLALPPRLRVFEAGEQQLADWIAAGEQRYGRRIRSDDELRVW